MKRVKKAKDDLSNIEEARGYISQAMESLLKYPADENTYAGKWAMKVHQKLKDANTELQSLVFQMRMDEDKK